MVHKLSSLLDGITFKVPGEKQEAFIDVDILGVTDDSRDVKAGFAFIAYPGETVDGRNYIERAIDNGAVAILAESGLAYSQEVTVPVIEIDSLRLRCGEIASAFYGAPSEKLSVIGITGTNGKTSVAYLLTQLFENLGKNSCMIGTLGEGAINKLNAGENTTPGAIKLQSLFAQYVEQGVDVVVMEVSSIAVEQGRINGVDFDVSALTNFSRDHLDYHKTMEAYAQAKQEFMECFGTHKVINIDDELGRQTRKNIDANVISFGNCADLQSDNVVNELSGMSFDVSYNSEKFRVKSSLLGAFNQENLLTVIGCALSLGLSLEAVVEQIKFLRPPIGRMEIFRNKTEETHAVVDYAHTPDALEKLLSAVSDVSENNISLVFGCGGDRDKGKRSLMAQASESKVSTVWVTSDNPRTEKPQVIIDDVLEGFSQPENVRVIIDRVDAITQAAKSLLKNEVLVVAGKGHENYQEIMGVRHPFSDQEVLKSLGFTTEFVGDAA